jgi:type I restriction enzyme, S subunit
MELLVRHFEAAFAAPDGIKKLRELILILAMQGKLVPQNPSDPPASDLLKAIDREKQSLMKDGNLKNSRPLPSVTEPERTFTLPDTWAWVRLGAVAQHNSGKTLDGSRNSGTSRDYITTSNLYWGRFELDSIRQMLIRDEELERCTTKKGDLLVCEGGEAGRAAVWDRDTEVCFQNHIHRVRFYGKISPYYGFRFFEYLNVSGEIEKYRKGVGIWNMSSKALASIPLPLPPIAEQLRIVKRIDELMARCDALEKLRQERDTQRLAVHTAAVRQLLNVADTDGHIQAREFLGRHFGELYAVKENVTELRKAILQLAVMGKLVPQDPNEPPASGLLKQIEKEKQRLVKEGKIREPKPLPPIAPEEIPYALPQGWAWVHFGEVAEFINGDRGKNYPNREEYVPEGIPWINTGHIEPDGTLTKREMYFITKEKFDSLNGGKIQPGDLVYCLRGATFGKTAIVDPYTEGAIASSLMIIRPFQPVSNRYMYHYLVGPTGRKQILRFDNGSAQPNLSANSVRYYMYPLPPVGEQNRIVAKIDQLMSFCDAIEERIDAANETQSALLDAMMAQYGGQRCA